MSKESMKSRMKAQEPLTGLHLRLKERTPLQMDRESLV